MKLTGGAAWSASERRARDAAAVAARWGEQGAGPACQSKVGSALRGCRGRRRHAGPVWQRDGERKLAMRGACGWSGPSGGGRAREGERCWPVREGNRPLGKEDWADGERAGRLGQGRSVGAGASRAGACAAALGCLKWRWWTLAWGGSGPCGANGLEARREGWAVCGRKSWAGFVLLFFFSLFKLNSTYLNSRGFEFKTYNTQTIKTMLQHDATTSLNLK